MTIYSQIKAKFKYPERVQPIYKYYAYKDGIAAIFDNRNDAHNHSKHVEQFQYNKDEYALYTAKYNEVDSAVYTAWEAALRVQYPNITTEVFDKCMSMAYDRGHSSGYDEVESYLNDYINFAIDILGTVKQ